MLPIWLASTYKYHKRAFLSGWFFGFGFFGAGISWVHVSIATFGGVPLFVSIFLMLLLCGYLALYIGAFSYLLKRFFSLRLWPLAAPFLWLLIEYARAHVLTGFPWLSIGYTQSTSIFSAYYPIIGEIGLSGLMILLSSAIAVLLVNVLTRFDNINTEDELHQNLHVNVIKQSLAVLIVTTVSFTSAFIFYRFPWVETLKSPYSVALVQGNIEQSIRWRPEQDRPTMEKYLRLSNDAWGTDIIIWPEAAVPKLEILATAYLELLDEQATNFNSALITGVVDVSLDNDEAYNTLLALGLDSQTDNLTPYIYRHKNRFKKHHLLPIGEFVPFENILRPLAPIFNLPMSSFNRGDYVQNNLKAKGLSFAPAICFEIAFPLQMAANIRENTDAIVTVSNDAWFGDSHGPHQHLEIARVRAMEFGKPVLRATNTGLTAAYDHQGNLLGVLPQFEDAVLSVDVERIDGKTPYTQYGNLPTYLLALLSFLFAIYFRNKSQK
uniref:apolipoprotein N-acyltransferase n=1 Tax=Ningiella ruwaisensis TaxID=2364274 RepID=UPI001F4F598C|nr:apolipoprotein N-acyltransferase [Ningiella ruwaisensis]